VLLFLLHVLLPWLLPQIAAAATVVVVAAFDVVEVFCAGGYTAEEAEEAVVACIMVVG
jgi:ABC-type spermidine/putrescine transport system permease subunit II